jgi:hypothetical protein
MGQIDEHWLWHRIMDHINFDNLVKISTKQVLRDMPKISKPANILCKQCYHGKQTREIFKSKEYSITNPLEIVHMGLYGPTRTQNIQGENYFMLLIDDYCKITQVTFLKENFEAFEKFK